LHSEAEGEERTVGDGRSLMTSERKDVAPRVAVLSGNRMEFDRYVYEKKLLGSTEAYIYIHEPRQLLGMQLDSMDVIGTFMDRPNSQEIYDLARMRIGPPAGIDWKQYYTTVSITESQVKKPKTADEKYNEWALKNPVIPTDPNDTDFPRKKPPVAFSGKHSFDSLRDWQDNKPSIPLPLLDENANPVDQSLTETYIQMHRNTEDDANLKRSMEIMYPDNGVSNGKTKKD
jgi:hypothetical protein